MNRIIVKFKIDFDFVLIAVTSSLKDYRICYLINKHLNFNFVKTTDLAVDLQPDTEPVCFSFYQYQPKDTDTRFYFIQNKGTEGFLIPEMKETDYFLMIKEIAAEEDADKFVNLLNRITEIVAAVKIDPKKIKSRENLLF